jgi:hypothetical protein
MMQDAQEADDVNWKKIGKEDLKPAMKRYRRYLEDKGLRASTIPMYVLHVSKYLEFCGTDSPCADDFARFRDLLHDRKLSRSTINNYSFSVKRAAAHPAAEPAGYSK